MLQDKQDVQTSTDVGQVQDQQGQDMTFTSGSKPLQDMDKGKDMQDELETLRKRVQELEQYEPKTKTEIELQLEQKEQELWAKEVSLTLKEHNLEPFADFINASDSEELGQKVEKLKLILSQLKLDGAFVPSSHKSSDKYDHALKMGDTKGAIASKLSQLFK